MDRPETRYAKSGDVNIAYQIVGEGEHDVVFIPGFVSHVELGWENAHIKAMYERLAALGRLIIFDKRGTGLSDRVGGIATIEERMDDARAVMDAAGSRRAALVGISEGGPLTLVFAATYPERTEAAVLFGSSLGVWTTETPWLSRREENLARLPALEQRWGTIDYAREFLAARAPSIAADDEALREAAAFMRASASPGALVQLVRMNAEIDIRHVLPTVRVPTLLCHRVDDVIPIANARYIASHVPGARLIELPGRDHAPWFEPEQWIAPLDSFLHEVRAGETWADADGDRVLATVLFTDIVGSTAKAAELGDRAWRELLERHHQLARVQLARFRGREVDTAGDGFFATFDGPARAIRCARAICDGVRALGLDVRAGLHTGEVELDDGRVRGIAVHIGARVASAAGAGEVLVSSTVKDLVAGSGLEFEERGAAELKGVPGEWRLFAVKR